MPIYEYRCTKCRKKFSVLVGVTADSREPACPRCGSDEIRKLISRFSRLKDEDAILDDLEDAAYSAGDDPRAVRKLMREMGKELGEDADEDFEELLDEAEREMYEEDDQSDAEPEE
ncbi:MAG: zinc ribbon domain-containing protein [Armatimonadota bacterium]|nr:zinc ribbon domain-containing protein [Armatimonadota bacterium]